MRRVSMGALVPSAPFLPDTDAETSIDLEKSVEALQDTKRNFTKTIFDVTVKERQTASHDSDYECRLRQEIRDWKDHITKALTDLKKAKEKPPLVDCSILSKERREFLEQAPDLSRFLLRMRDVRSLAVKFMEHDYAEFMDFRENLHDFLHWQLKQQKHTCMAELSARDDDFFIQSKKP